MAGVFKLRAAAGGSTLQGGTVIRGGLTAQIVAVGLAQEADSAQDVLGYQPARALKIRPVKSRVLGQALETDLAQSRVSLGQVTETDEALPMVAAFTATSRALKMTVLKTAAVGQASETDAARSLANRIKVVLGQAVEIDSGTITSVGGHVSAPVAHVRLSAQTNTRVVLRLGSACPVSMTSTHPFAPLVVERRVTKAPLTASRVTTAVVHDGG